VVARISTKIGRVLRRPLGPDAIKDQWLGGLEFQTLFDYGYDGVMRSFEDSLQRLGINRVDVLLIHDLDPWDHNEATLSAYFTQLKTSGWKALAELRAPIYEEKVVDHILALAKVAERKVTPEELLKPDEEALPAK